MSNVLSYAKMANLMFHRTQSINQPILIYKLINSNMLVDFSPTQSSKLCVRNDSTTRPRITKFCAKLIMAALKVTAQRLAKFNLSKILTNHVLYHHSYFTSNSAAVFHSHVLEEAFV